jgi:TolA-binding protein
MTLELERLGRDVRDELGEPSPEWLRTQRRDLTVALGLRSPRALGPWWAAAALLGMLGVAVWTWSLHWRPTGPTPVDTMLSASTTDRNVALADGSRLLLAAQTRVRLKAGERVTRCVLEVGKVQLDVVPQGGREFSVQAGDLLVTVVGTRFSVSRDPGGMVEVAVSHGVVRVLVPHRDTKTEVRAGDRLRSDGTEVLLQRATAASASGARSPSSQASAEAAEPLRPRQDAQPAPDGPSSGGRAAHADWLSLYRARDYTAALAAARASGIEGLLQSLTAQPLSELADAARLGGDGDLALRVFATLGQRFPSSRQAQDALFLSGRLLASRGQLNGARGQLEAYLARNGRGTYSVEALGRLLEIYATNKDPRAKAIAQAYLERAPHGPYERLCRTVLAAP